MSNPVFTGVRPALMTPCGADGKPNFDALVGMGPRPMAEGMSAVVYCGSMGDWPLLDDAQRMEGVERLVGEERAFVTAVVEKALTTRPEKYRSIA